LIFSEIHRKLEPHLKIRACIVHSHVKHPLLRRKTALRCQTFALATDQEPHNPLVATPNVVIGAAKALFLQQGFC
jgi:hypothetical protein